REQDSAYFAVSCLLFPVPYSPCGGACVGTGGRLLSASSQVRFLPPQLRVPLAERLRHWSSKPNRRVRFPQGTLSQRMRGSANGRPPGFEPGDEGSNPSPRVRSCVRGPLSVVRCTEGVAAVLTATDHEQRTNFGSHPAG